jgi:hypothetical protein
LDDGIGYTFVLAIWDELPFFSKIYWRSIIETDTKVQWIRAWGGILVLNMSQNPGPRMGGIHHDQSLSRERLSLSPRVPWKAMPTARHTRSLVRTLANSPENMSTEPSKAAWDTICLKNRQGLLLKPLLTLMGVDSCSSVVQPSVLKYQE